MNRVALEPKMFTLNDLLVSVELCLECACYVCKHTTRQQQQRRDTRYHCRECDIALYLDPCCEEYHTMLRF
ncbi:hypothetical protein E2C01_030418 [Portunus trituberculatus]|uniref:PiggyBac transposable element-derived protein 4 C-terminal zinc-ribbon domain-containing protein n=1 Tax=Portunus trituberculatus TaxID=210409 RepID=A0A5B7EUT2_PORTR|nr:hypothetical protein [Portunus trituberculatus]